MALGLSNLAIGIKRRLLVGPQVRLVLRFHLGLFSFISAPRHLTIGDDVYVGKFCTVQVNGTIGRGVRIANNVGIVGRRDNDMCDVGKPMTRAALIGATARMAAIRETGWPSATMCGSASAQRC